MTKEEKNEKMKRINEALRVAYTYDVDDEIHRLECDLEYLLKEETK